MRTPVPRCYGGPRDYPFDLSLSGERKTGSSLSASSFPFPILSSGLLFAYVLLIFPSVSTPTEDEKILEPGGKEKEKKGARLAFSPSSVWLLTSRKGFRGGSRKVLFFLYCLD